MYIDPVPTKSQILFCVQGEVQEKGWKLPLLSMLCLSVPTECGRRGFYLNIPCCPPDPGTHSTMWELSWARAAAPECGGKSLVSALKTRSPLPCPSYYIETLPSHHLFFCHSCMKATASCFLTAHKVPLSLTWLYWWKISPSHTCDLCEPCCCSGAQNEWDTK